MECRELGDDVSTAMGHQELLSPASSHTYLCGTTRSPSPLLLLAHPGSTCTKSTAEPELLVLRSWIIWKPSM
jgi:hypothetical protein